MGIQDRPNEVIGAAWGAQSVNREYENIRDLQFQLAAPIIPAGGGTSNCDCTAYTSPLATLVDVGADFTNLIADATAVGGDNKAHLIWVRDENISGGAFSGYGYFAVRHVDSATQIRVYDPSGYLSGKSGIAYTATYDSLHAAKYGQLHNNVNSHPAGLLARPVDGGSQVYSKSIYGPTTSPANVSGSVLDLSSFTGPIASPTWGAFRVRLTNIASGTTTIRVTLSTAAASPEFSRRIVWHTPGSSLIDTLYEYDVMLPLEAASVVLDVVVLGGGAEAADVEVELYGLGG